MTLDQIQIIVSTATSLVGVVIALYAAFRLTKGGKFRLGSAGVFSPEVTIEAERVRQSTGSGGHNDSTDRQYLLLREDHAQGLAQSKISFWFSLVFAALGFIVIITAIFTIEREVAITQQGRTLVSLIAGTIIDAVSALFFVQSNKARQLMVDFFDRLRNDKKLEESLRLARDIPDTALRSRLNALIALHFADIKLSDNFLKSALDVSSEINAPVVGVDSAR